MAKGICVMNDGVRILVVDDETQLLKLLGVTLTSHGFKVHEAVTGQEALSLVGTYKPDVIILDLGLPDMDGLEVIQSLRKWTRTPIIILSAREQEKDKIIALDAGADDYLTKPFGMGELLARIRAALRHIAGVQNEPVLKFNDLVIDLTHRRVNIDGKEIKLSPTEYDLVKNLAIGAGKVLTHKYLLRTVWGPSYENDVHYLRVYMGQLRRKIEVDPSRPRHIITETGIGYRLL